MGHDFIDKIIHAGPEAQAILLTLAFLSVYCFAVIGHKVRLVRRAEREMNQFMVRFRQARDLEQIQEAAQGLTVSPINALVTAAVREVQQLRKLIGKGEERRFQFDHTVMMRDSLLMTMERVIAEKSEEMRSHLIVLATTTTIGPFLGLLGTVWGIMIAFLDIASKGSANINVVAPGVADALITTIAGLVVAIPAVIGYNYLTTRVRQIIERCTNFSMELAGIIYKSSLNL